MSSIKKQMEPVPFKGRDLPRSAGILEDYDIKKDIQTRNITTQSAKVTDLTASRGVFTDANKLLTTTGTLPTSQGGTSLTTYAQGDVIYAVASNSLGRVAKDTTATRYLSNTGASNNPAWAQINVANGVTGTLPLANGGTGATAFAADRIPFMNDANTAFTSSADFTFDAVSGLYLNLPAIFNLGAEFYDTTYFFGTTVFGSSLIFNLDSNVALGVYDDIGPNPYLIVNTLPSSGTEGVYMPRSRVGTDQGMYFSGELSLISTDTANVTLQTYWSSSSSQDLNVGGTSGTSDNLSTWSYTGTVNYGDGGTNHTFNYYDSGGGIIHSIKTGASSTFGTAIEVPDDAYASGWNASVEVPTKNAIYDKIESMAVTSGTYTPTLTNTTNVAASTARQCTYVRVGNTVTVGGQFDIDPTTTLTATLMGISLPIASNFSTAYQCGGTASAIAIAGMSGGIEADATNNRASLRFLATDVTNQTMTFSFTYEVI